MTEFFSSKDFDFYCDSPKASTIADIANKKLQAALGPKLYFTRHRDLSYSDFSPEKLNGDTHTCVAFNIQPIEKECVEHEPPDGWIAAIETGSETIKCKNCGKKLKATRWEVAE